MPTCTTNQNVHSTDVSRATAASDDAGNRTLARGLQVLDTILGAVPEGLRVVDLCRATGLERATVYRLLATLTQSGYVGRQGRFRYVPGPHLAQSPRATQLSSLAARLQPVLAQVSAVCGDAAFAVVRDGPLSHCIARQMGTHPVQILVIEVGTRQPLGVGAAGLALLAALPDTEVRGVIQANAPVLAAYGGMTPERLELLVRATRERGWSVVGNHATRGVLAVGMAVRDARNMPVAGISVATTMARLPRQRQQLIARAMRDALTRHGVAGSAYAERMTPKGGQHLVGAVPTAQPRSHCTDASV